MSEKTIQRARSLEQLASDLQRAGKYHEAEEPLRTAIGLWTLLRGPGDIEVLNDEMCLAVSFRRRGDVALAIPLLERVVDALEQSSDSEATYYRRLAFNNLAIAYRVAGRLVEARDLLTQLLAHLDELLANAPDPGDFAEGERDAFVTGISGVRVERARVLDNLATVALDQDDSATATVSARRALDEWRSLRGADDIDTAISMSALGTSLMRSGLYAEARAHLQSSQEVIEELAGEEHPVVCGALALRGELEYRTGNFLGATPLLERCLKIADARGLTEDHPDRFAAVKLLDVIARRSGSPTTP